MTAVRSRARVTWACQVGALTANRQNAWPAARGSKTQADARIPNAGPLREFLEVVIAHVHASGKGWGRHAAGRIRQPRWRGSVCRSSTGSPGCGYIGPHHRSGAVTKDCTLRSDQPPFRRSRSRRGALSLRKAHRYVPVFLQRIKLSRGPAWRQGGWAIMAQFDERFKATTKS